MAEPDKVLGEVGSRLDPHSLQHVAVVGADLDLTLIDSRRATAVAIERVNRDCGTDIDVDHVIGRLGLPLRSEFARWMRPEQIPPAVDAFRSAFMTDGLAELTPLPGAGELADLLNTAGRGLIVVTSRIHRIATACLATCRLPIAAVVGGVTGPNKAPGLREHSVGIYIGDHALDMQAATAAGIPGVGVTTGNHTGQDLNAAGATYVVPDLTAVVAALR